jgi:hypothetical protein
LIPFFARTRRNKSGIVNAFRQLDMAGATAADPIPILVHVAPREPFANFGRCNNHTLAESELWQSHKAESHSSNRRRADFAPKIRIVRFIEPATKLSWSQPNSEQIATVRRDNVGRRFRPSGRHGAFRILISRLVSISNSDTGLRRHDETMIARRMNIKYPPESSSHLLLTRSRRSA